MQNLYGILATLTEVLLFGAFGLAMILAAGMLR